MHKKATDPKRKRLDAVPVRMTAVDVRGPGLRGPTAMGALAVGAAAIGALAVGRLAIGRATIKKLTIDDLDVRRLRVEELEIVREHALANGEPSQRTSATARAPATPPGPGRPEDDPAGASLLS